MGDLMFKDILVEFGRASCSGMFKHIPEPFFGTYRSCLQPAKPEASGLGVGAAPPRAARSAHHALGHAAAARAAQGDTAR